MSDGQPTVRLQALIDAHDVLDKVRENEALPFEQRLEAANAAGQLSFYIKAAAGDTESLPIREFA